MYRGRGGGRAHQKVTNQAAKERFLGSSLGGAVFGATAETLRECTTGLVFGLPASNWNWVQHVTEGMPIFLFNYTDKLMHGIFRAVTPGTQNINPYGWTSISRTAYTRYPAQVQVELFEMCQPIVDRDFKAAIQGAFFTDRQFNYQLTSDEARRLCHMFSKSATKRLYEARQGKAGATAEQHASAQGSPALCGPSSPTRGVPSTHLSRRPTPSSSTGSSDLRQVAALKDTSAGPATSSPDSAVNQPRIDCGSRDTSASRGKQVESSQQMTEQMSQAAPTPAATAGLGEKKGSRGLPPGFEQPMVESTPAANAKLNPIPNAWFKSKGLQHTAAMPDATAVAGTQPQPGSLPAKPMPASRQQRYRPDEAERSGAEQSTGDQEAKRSRTGQSPHHPTAITPCLVPDHKKEAQFHGDVQASGNQPVSTAAVPVPPQHQSQQQQPQPQHQPQQQPDSQPRREHEPQQPQESGVEAEDVNMLGTTPPRSYGARQLAAATAEPASTQPGQKIYLLGGGTENQASMWLNTVDMYSPSSHSCMPATSLPKECAYGSAAAIGNKLFYVGGGNGRDWFSSMLRLSIDDAEGHWEQMADMHVGRGSLCTVNLGSTLWAIGGRDSHGFHDSTECFHPALNIWTFGPSTSTKRFAAAGGTLGGAIYITGGFDASTYTASAERLDPREKEWSQIPNMLSSRGSHACAVLGDKLYAIGGYAALKPLREVEMYDPRANKWQAVASLKDTRAYFAGVACQGALYAMGGLSPEQGAPNYKHTLEKYNPLRNRWEVLLPAANTLPARAFMSACIV